jgi:bleomycin hydrolase
MSFTAYDRPDPKKEIVKYKVENSWGAGSGDHGFLHMYMNWFRANVYEIVVPRELLSDAEKTALGAKPLKLRRREGFY